MQQMKIKPFAGRTVRDPRTMVVLSPKGEVKPRNSYWLRRLKAGDVVVVQENVKPKKGANK